jgi:hypothetical protein
MINQKLSQILNKELDTIIIHSKSITLEIILDALIKQKTLVSASKNLNVSRSTLQKACLDLFPNKPNKQLWRNYLLSLLNYRHCFICDQILPAAEFNDWKVTRYTCTTCTKMRSKQHYELNIDKYKEWSKIWRMNNPDKMRANDAKRRARETGAFSIEANQDIIKVIYRNCPLDYHVDHIIPISKGGLHHENNLCYLPAALNQAKRDKMPETVPEIMQFAIFPNIEVSL